MRTFPVLLAVLSASVVAGCTSGPEQVAGEAKPVGAATPAVSASGPAPVTTEPSASPTVSKKTTAAPRPVSTTAGRNRTIRDTDWAGVTLKSLRFMGFGDTRFRGGTASSGANNCTMLPGGASPAYGEFLTEEPADSPVTEDALVLIECGSDGMDQALIPVQLGYDQKSRVAAGFIKADPPTGPGKRMTFVSYSVDGEAIVTTVRKPGGGTEKRRYRFDGGTKWVRS